MATISLSFYTIQIIDTSTNHPTTKSFTDLSGKTLTEALYNHFYATAYDYQNDKSTERLFRTISFNENDHMYNDNLYYSSVSATVKTGNYGSEAELIDSEDTSKPRRIKATEAPILPFSFAVYYNPLKDTALLVTQSISRNSISSVIKEHLSNMVQQLCPSFKIIIKNVIPHELLRQLLNNEKIKNIKIETYKNANYTIEDELGSQTNIKPAKTFTVFKNPRISNKSFLFDLFSQHKKISRIAGLTSDDETIENLSIEFNHKTLNYNAYTSTKVSENITHLIDDPANVSPHEIYTIMDEKAFSYLKSARIIQEIPSCDFDSIEEKHIKYFEVDGSGNVNERTLTSVAT
jgi:hypothetical protein